MYCIFKRKYFLQELPPSLALLFITQTMTSYKVEPKRDGGSSKIDPYKFFGLPPKSTTPLDIGVVWKLFEEKGFSILTSTIANGFDSRSNKLVDIKQYSCINAVIYDQTGFGGAGGVNSVCEGAVLYAKTKEIMERYVHVQVSPALEAVTGSRLLFELRSRWHNHLFMSCWMRRFMQHLDATLMNKTSQVYTGSMVLRTFFDCAYTPHKKNIIAALLLEITKYREGRIDDPADMILIADVSLLLTHLGAVSQSDHIKKVVDSNKEFTSGNWKRAPALVKQEYASEIYTFLNLKIYHGDFQHELIQRTKEYYQHKCAGWVVQDTVSEYLAKAVRALEMERCLVRQQLNGSTMKQLIEACQDSILRGPASSMLEAKSGGGGGTLKLNLYFVGYHSGTIQIFLSHSLTFFCIIYITFLGY